MSSKLTTKKVRCKLTQAIGRRLSSSLLSLSVLLSIVSVCQQTDFQRTSYELDENDVLATHHHLGHPYLQAGSTVQQDYLSLNSQTRPVLTASFNANHVLRDTIDDSNQLNLSDADYLALLELKSRLARRDALARRKMLLVKDEHEDNKPSLASPLAQASSQAPSEIISMRSGISDIRVNGSNNVDTEHDPYAASNLISISPEQFALQAPVSFLPRMPQSFIEQQQQQQSHYGPLAISPMTQMDGTSMIHDQAIPSAREAAATHKYSTMKKIQKQAQLSESSNNDDEAARVGEDDRRSTAFYADLHQQQQQPSLSQQHQLMMPQPQHSQQAYMSTFNPQQPMYPFSPIAPMSGYIPFDRPVDQSIGATATSFGSPPPSRDLSAPQRTLTSLTNGQLMALIEELKEFNGRYAATNKTASSSSALARKKKPPETRKSPEVDKASNPTDDEDDDSSSEGDTTDNDGNESNTERETASTRTEKHKKEPKFTPDKDDLAKFAKFLLTKEGANMKFQLSLDKDAPDDGDETDEKDDLLDLKRSHRSKQKKIKSKKKLDDMDERNSRAASQLDRLIEDLTERAAELEREEQLKRKNKDQEGDGSKVDAFSEGYRRARRDDADTDVARLKVRTEFKTKKLDRPPLKPLRSEKGHLNNQPKRLIADELLQDKQENEQDSGESSEVPEKVVKPRFIKRLGNVVGRTINTTDNTEPQRKKIYKKRVVVKNSASPYENQRKKVLREDLRRFRKVKSKYRTIVPISAGIIGKDVLDSPIADLGTQYYNNGSLELANGQNGKKLSIYVPRKQKDLENSTQSEVGNDVSQTQSVPLLSDSSNNTISFKTSRIADEYPISERVGERLNKLSNSLDQYFNDGFLKEIHRKSKMKAPNENKPEKETSTDSKRDNGTLEKGQKESVSEDKDGKREFNRKSTKTGSNKNDSRDKETASSITRGRIIKKPIENSSSVTSRQDPGGKRDPVDNETLDTPIGPDEN